MVAVFWSFAPCKALDSPDVSDKLNAWIYKETEICSGDC